MAGHPTYHVNVIKLKCKIVWTGGLPRSPTWGPPPPCKQALKPPKNFNRKRVRKIGEKTGQLIGDKIYNKFSDKPTDETKDNEIIKILQREYKTTKSRYR